MKKDLLTHILVDGVEYPTFKLENDPGTSGPEVGPGPRRHTDGGRITYAPLAKEELSGPRVKYTDGMRRADAETMIHILQRYSVDNATIRRVLRTHGAFANI